MHSSCSFKEETETVQPPLPWRKPHILYLVGSECLCFESSLWVKVNLWKTEWGSNSLISFVRVSPWLAIKVRLSGRSGSHPEALDRIKSLKGQDHFQPIVLLYLWTGLFAKELWSQNYYVIPTVMTHRHQWECLFDINAWRPAISQGLFKAVLCEPTGRKTIENVVNESVRDPDFSERSEVESPKVKD